MCSLQISVLFVLMRVEISLFSSGILGSCGVFLLVKFPCAILLRMGCGRSLSVSRTLPTGMCFLHSWQSMLVNVLLASCMSVGGCSAVKASSVSCVNLSQSAFHMSSWYMTVCSVVLCVCCQSALSAVLEGDLSLAHGLPSRSLCRKVRMIWR